MALVPVAGAVKLLAAVFGHDVDLRSTLQTVFRRIVVQLYVHFRDGIDIDSVAEIAAAATTVAAVTTVDSVHVDGLPAGLSHYCGNCCSETAAERILVHSLLYAR